MDPWANAYDIPFFGSKHVIDITVNVAAST